MPGEITISQGDVRTPLGSYPVIALIAVGIGGYLLWFGVKYWRASGELVWPSTPIKSVLQGKGLPAGQRATSASVEVTAWEQGAGGMISGGATASGQQIAAGAFRYQGAPYKWGGATPAGWDCSGFVNWVLGHDLGQALPGVPAGQFTGASHGPVVASWLAWPGAQRILQPALGDLACWGPNEHMGICLSPTMMISALDPALGTQVTTIVSAHAGPPVYLRLVSAASQAAQPATTTRRRSEKPRAAA